MARIGELLDGKYEILSLVGEGGMSRVWLARDQHLNKLWAVKEIKRKERDENNEIVIQSLIAEANLMKELDHPALVRIVDIQQTESTIYVIMDYIQGETLSDILKDRGLFDEESVIEIGIQLCDALEYLHTRTPPVIYRDMKPSNVMLRDDGTVRLIDFGIARKYNTNSSHDTKVLGTQGYAPPEQYDENRQSDVRSDIYALGVTLYRLLTGRQAEAFQTTPIREINPGFSEGLERILLRATQVNPNDRYQSCAEMRYDLEHYEQLTTEYRSFQESKLRRFRTAAVAAGVCAVLGAGCIFVSNRMVTSTYESYVERAGTATREASGDGPSSAEELYTRAVETDPTRIETYGQLLDVYREDRVFTSAESDRWQQVWDAHQDEIAGKEGYALLCYNAARLYFGFYDYGGETGQRSAALRWYSYANANYEDSANLQGMPSQKVVQAYETVCGFYLTDAEEDEAIYGQYWQSLQDAFEGLSDDADVATQLHLQLLAVDALADPAILNGFARVAGVSQDDAAAFLNEVYAAAQRLNSNGLIGRHGNNEAMYEEIVAAVPMARATLEAEYGGVVSTQGEAVTDAEYAIEIPEDGETTVDGDTDVGAGTGAGDGSGATAGTTSDGEAD